jgi:hypothetical protein
MSSSATSFSGLLLRNRAPFRLALQRLCAGGASLPQRDSGWWGGMRLQLKIVELIFWKEGAISCLKRQVIGHGSKIS